MPKVPVKKVSKRVAKKADPVKKSGGGNQFLKKSAEAGKRAIAGAGVAPRTKKKPKKKVPIKKKVASKK